MPSRTLVAATFALFLAACALKPISREIPLLYESEQPVDSCYIDLSGTPAMGESDYNRTLVRLAEEHWTRSGRFDGRALYLHKAVLGRTNVEVFYVFDIAGVSDLYVVYATDVEQRELRRWFWYGSMYGPCQD